MTTRANCSAPLRRGALGFVAATFLSTWIPAWLLRGVWHVEHADLTTRILTCSAVYLGVMGWQPIVVVILVRRHVEDRYTLDAGLRGTTAKYIVLGAGLPALAMLVASLGCMFVNDPALNSAPVLAPNGLLHGLAGLACVLAACSLIYVQCLSEEVAWRGYFLVRVMGCLGPWRGLLLHGVVWGVWYAPVLLVTGEGGRGSMATAAQFMITSVLLGVLLGWLRLASRSIVPALLANVVLTLGAGLPILLGGVDPGARAAIYSPLGWAPLLLIAGWVALTRQRHAIRLPRPSASRLPRPSHVLH